jgi:hypothetical protein
MKLATFVQTLAALLAIATAQQNAGERFTSVRVLNDMPAALMIPPWHSSRARSV